MENTYKYLTKKGMPKSEAINLGERYIQKMESLCAKSKQNQIVKIMDLFN